MVELPIMAAFALAVLVAIAVPGPGALLVLGNTLSHGKGGRIQKALGGLLFGLGASLLLTRRPAA
ncbi:hypothetical protein Deipr_0250 [Deinococcus proteolyticus MRP]|uniref:Lysine exporter protein (LYSE/YGGA) n=1 Tax=Deinococcus proteolyticus (strain ATCC 35074 / DSM 20540 / JCM 6276 / NBRC 101906 / NCIMB 13154 / VKM Ac-1939 / CCM 2703 / MRP) TaxID=693977 RepID=F0RJ15_DEIPM|nr:MULTISPECIES: hypothetical protein [Deinococcus]ADY25423.1 hypothetical protein Deipr_0250 [Deinococcus proteolyticus MRP]MCY1701547.1 hypothetical protein [Deinococcus sp. SL84]